MTSASPLARQLTFAELNSRPVVMSYLVTIESELLLPNSTTALPSLTSVMDLRLSLEVTNDAETEFKCLVLIKIQLINPEKQLFIFTTQQRS